MTLVQKFTEKYGINPIKLVEDANLKFFGRAKSMGLEKLLSEYVDTEDIIIVNNDFIKELVECFAEEKKKFPENLKATVDTGTKFEIPNQMSSIPKSKGTLENFKDIVGTDDLRPIMMGVYVSEDGFIVGTDAHKLVKQKNNGLLSQTDYAGKIIDLTKYIKSNGKLIDFVDGVFPKYDAVIPRESPYEDRQLSTYAFYNYAKSSLEVKRLLNSDVFNVNFNLMTDTSGGTKRFSFGYHVLLDALNFAMLNNWDFFTLRYSEPNRAVLFDFGGDNVILVMPMIDRYDSSAEGGSTGTLPLTTEEVEEKYRLGLKQQKSSKPAKAPKKATVSASVNSEPFKKFEGNLSDTTYIPRREIASITLRNGDVLSGNDVIDGFYRVNKKMARGGSVEPRNPESFHKFYEDLTDLYFYAFELGNIEVDSDSIPINEKELKRLKIIISLLIKVSYGRIDLKMKTNFPEWVKDGMIIKPTLKEQLIEDEYKILADTIESKNLEKYAEGGSIEGLKVGSKVGFLRPRIGRYEWAEVLSIDGDNVNLVVRHPKRKQWDNYFTETKQRIEKYTNTVDENWHDGRGRTTMKIKYEHGGSMYANGGNMFETPIAKYKEVSGKVVGSVPVSEEIYSSRVKDFVEYVYEVYEDYGFTKKQVKEAVDKYINELGNQFTWGGGDSLDRERVYEYLRNPNLQGIKNPSFANGGSMSKSYEIGDIISFNSVMGGTKTGAIVSKLGEDGFRIKTEDGFATVKKSAIV